MNVIKRVYDWIRRPSDLPDLSPNMTNQEREEAKKAALSRAQAELIKTLLCDEGKKPEEMAKAFYKRFPRASFKHLWDKDEKGIRYLTEPELFGEGCDLADAAMKALGDVWEEDGKEYIKPDSPFLAVMKRAVMG